MKEEWKVYIKGVPNRGNEVIKALTDLGAKESFYTTSGSNEKFIHFINHKGVIDYEYLDTEPGQIIMDNYKEIKLPEKWNRGDILYSSDLGKYVVCSDFYRYGERIAYIIVSKDMIATFKDFPVHAYHLANSQEIEQFHELLHKHHKDWEAENKRLVDWRWTPEMTHKFYFVDINGKVKIGIHDKETDNMMFDFGNCFHTKDEAEKMAEKIKKLLKGES